MKAKTEAILKRRGLPFAAVDHVVIDDEHVTASALLVYVILCRHANYNTGVAFPSINLMQHRLKIRRQAITKAIIDLKALRYLTLERRPGLVNLYTVGPEEEKVIHNQFRLGTGSSGDQFRRGTGVVPRRNWGSSASEPERDTSSDTHKEIASSFSPGQEREVDRQAAIHGLRQVLRGLPEGEEIMRQIEAREEKKA
jgi:hypothetical protein